MCSFVKKCIPKFFIYLKYYLRGKELRKVSGDLRAGNFFGQSVNLAIQRGNIASVLGTLRSHSGPELNEICYINR